MSMLVGGVKRQGTLKSDCLIQQQFEQQATLYVRLCCYQIFCSEVRLWFAVTFVLKWNVRLWHVVILNATLFLPVFIIVYMYLRTC